MPDIWSIRCSGRGSTTRGGAALSAYRRWVEDELFPEFAAADRLAALAYGHPRLWYESMRAHPDVIEWFYDILRGESDYRALWRGPKPPAGGPLRDPPLRGGGHRCCISHPTKNVNTPTAVSCRSGPILYSGKKNRTTTFSVMRS